MELPTKSVPIMFKTEGVRAPIKIEPVWSQAAGSSAGGNGSLAASSDILKFYQEQGLESIAKEAGIVETTEELITLSNTPSSSATQPPKSKMIKLIAIPVSSSVRQPLKVIPRPIIVSGAYPGQTIQRVAVSMPQRTSIVQSNMQQQQHIQLPQLQHQMPRFQTIRPQQTPPVVPKVIQLITSPAYSTASQQYTQQSVQQQQQQLQTIHQQQPQQQPTVWTVKRPMVTHYQTVPPPAATPSTPASSFVVDNDFVDRRKKGAHGGKGLRHFSMKVCEKVQRKGITSYNEVADELVSEFTDMCGNDNLMTDHQFDQKNIRRRVYDALNVLMAMNIISKEKKEIRWIGLPTNSAQECQNLEVEKQKILERIQQKKQQLNELILQQIAFKNLVQRNKAEEESRGGCGPVEGSAIKLPFILIHTSKKTVIDCSISSDKYEYLFNFDQPFEIHDDIEVLKRMGLAFGLEKGRCNGADLEKALKMVPKSLESYVLAMAGVKATLHSQLTVSVKSEPGLTNDVVASTSRNLSDQMLDREVALATASGYGTMHCELSRQSSFGSASDLPSTAHDTPDYSDNTESDEEEMA